MPSRSWDVDAHASDVPLVQDLLRRRALLALPSPAQVIERHTDVLLVASNPKAQHTSDCLHA